MNVYVSWAYTGEARKAEERLVEWVDSLGKKTKAEKELLARLTPELCLPELIEFKELEADAPQYDKLNQNLLAVRFVTPKLGRTVTYQLGKRMPGSGKLALSLAARSHLLKTFEGEWEYESEKPKGKVTFVGHSGTGDFLTALRFACMKGRVGLAKLLLQYKAYPNAMSASGFSALDAAVVHAPKHSVVQIRSLLHEAGLPDKPRDREDWASRRLADVSEQAYFAKWSSSSQPPPELGVANSF